MFQTPLKTPAKTSGFTIKIGCNAQCEYLFSMYVDDFLPISLIYFISESIFDEKIISQWNTIYLRLLAMKGFDAIQPEYNCFISMIISVDTLCGFAPLVL